MTIKTVEAQILELPEEVRLYLAEHAAQQFLDGVEKGRTTLIEAGVERMEGMKNDATDEHGVCMYCDNHPPCEYEMGYEQAKEDAVTALQELNAPTERAVAK